MSERAQQTQKGGPDSTNIQADQLIVVQGLSVADVREIALDIFKNNFVQLSEVARETAETRAREITETFLQKLKQDNEAGLQRAESPDFQLSLLTVQREYARHGDQELADLLVDLLVDLTRQSSRSITEIVLHESLSVAPKLTTDQLATLAIIFEFRYTRHFSALSLEHLARLCRQLIKPFVSSLTKKNTCYQHLEFAGCGTVSMGEIPLEYALAESYPAAFTLGFSREELRVHVPEITTDSVLSPCLQDPSLFQFSGALDDESLRLLFANAGLSKEIADKASAFWVSKRIGQSSIPEALVKVVPEMEIVFDVWNNSKMKHFELTSVGIAIAHAMLRNKAGLHSDLSIWVN